MVLTNFLDLLSERPALEPFDRQAWALAAPHTPNAGWSNVPSPWWITWNDEWPDPTDASIEGSPRRTSLNAHMAVFGGAHGWLDAWNAIHGADHNPVGANLGRLCEDVLVAMGAVALHSAGRLETFEQLLNLWVRLDHVSPEDTDQAWRRAHWLTVPQRPSEAPSFEHINSTHPVRSHAPPRPPVASPALQTSAWWRLRWVDHWLDDTEVRRQGMDEVRWGRVWSWVDQWVSTQELTLADLVGHHYRATPGSLRSSDDASDTDSSSSPTPALAPLAGNGWALAWQSSTVSAIEAWTRWERTALGPKMVHQQWSLALDSLLATEDGRNHHAHDRIPGWIAWGERRILDGDALPGNALIGDVARDDDDTILGPSMTVHAWRHSTSEQARCHRLPPARPHEGLCAAFDRWERAALTVSANAALAGVADVAPRARPRL